MPDLVYIALWVLLVVWLGAVFALIRYLVQLGVIRYRRGKHVRDFLQHSKQAVDEVARSCRFEVSRQADLLRDSGREPEFLLKVPEFSDSCDSKLFELEARYVPTLPGEVPVLVLDRFGRDSSGHDRSGLLDMSESCVNVSWARPLPEGWVRELPGLDEIMEQMAPRRHLSCIGTLGIHGDRFYDRLIL